METQKTCQLRHAPAWPQCRMRRAGKQMQLPHVSKTTPSCFNQERSVVFLEAKQLHKLRTLNSFLILRDGLITSKLKTTSMNLSRSNTVESRVVQMRAARNLQWLLNTAPKCDYIGVCKFRGFIWISSDSSRTFQNQLQKAIPAYWARPTRQRVWPKIFRREPNSTNPPPKTFWIVLANDGTVVWRLLTSAKVR